MEHKLRYSLCIEMMFPDLPFDERIEASVKAGISELEIWHWSRHDLNKLSDQLDAHGASLMMMNIACSFNKDIDEQLWSGGITSVDSNQAIMECLDDSLEVCNRFGVKRMVLLPGNQRQGMTREAQLERLKKLLEQMAPVAEKQGVTFLLEPLNTYSRPSVILSKAKQGFQILEELDKPNVKLLYDLFHQQMMEGDLIHTIRKHIDRIGHVHISDAPDRLPPGQGEINCVSILKLLQQLEYTGYAGMEYISPTNTAATLGFMI